MPRVFILYLCSLTLRSLALWILARLVASGIRRVEYRHAVWTVFLFSILLMPLADAVLPRTLVPASVPAAIMPIQTLIVFTPQVSAVPMVATSPSAASPSIDGWQIGSTIILLGGIGLLTRFVLILGTVQRLKRSSFRIEMGLPEQPPVDRQRLAIAESRSVRVPVTVGFWKPLIILPADWYAWEDWKLQSVLLHERTHVRRRDWAISVVAAFAKSVFWFNPLLWWLERQLSTLAELASDEACVRHSRNPRRYAETLLQFATAARQGQRWIGGVAMAQHKISFRIERVLALQKPGSGVLSRAAWIVLIVASLPILYASAATQSGAHDPTACGRNSRNTPNANTRSLCDCCPSSRTADSSAGRTANGSSGSAGRTCNSQSSRAARSASQGADAANPWPAESGSCGRNSSDPGSSRFKGAARND